MLGSASKQLIPRSQGGVFLHRSKICAIPTQRADGSLYFKQLYGLGWRGFGNFYGFAIMIGWRGVPLPLPVPVPVPVPGRLELEAVDQSLCAITPYVSP